MVCWGSAFCGEKAEDAAEQTCLVQCEVVGTRTG